MTVSRMWQSGDLCLWHEDNGTNPWPLIGPEWSRGTDTSVSLAEDLTEPRMVPITLLFFWDTETWRHAQWPASLESLADSHADINPFVRIRKRKSQMHTEKAWVISEILSYQTFLFNWVFINEPSYEVVAVLIMLTVMSVSELNVISARSWAPSDNFDGR